MLNDDKTYNTNGGVRSKIFNIRMDKMKLGIRMNAMGSEFHNILCNGSGNDGSYIDSNSIGFYITGTDNFINSCRVQLFYYGALITGANNRLVTVKTCVNQIGTELRPGSSGFYNIDLQGKKVVLVGRSNIVGKPMIQCMLNKNSTVTVCHSRTKDIGEVIKRADIVIAAIGKPKFVKADMVKDGAVVIDVGINRLEDGSICGDVDFEAISEKASYITPVPGGVGPMTIAMLLNNVVKAAKK